MFGKLPLILPQIITTIKTYFDYSFQNGIIVHTSIIRWRGSSVIFLQKQVQKFERLSITKKHNLCTLITFLILP